eukprot:364116-Chlamydomonas_euryale.AAC.3
MGMRSQRERPRHGGARGDMDISDTATQSTVRHQHCGMNTDAAALGSIHPLARITSLNAACCPHRAPGVPPGVKHSC